MSTVPPGALDRLMLSRERLRQALREAEAPRDEVPDERGFAGAWLDRLKSIPAAGVVIEAVRGWWAKHPMREPTTVAADTATAVVQPVAEQHPLGLVLGAALLGGLFGWSRARRLLLSPAVLGGVLPQLLRVAKGQRPVPSWLLALTALANKKRVRSAPGGHRA